MLSQRHKSKSPNINTNRTRNMNKQASIPVMSVNTRHFIKKICFQQAASVDMTKYGFVRDSKLQPINLMLKPLRDQLDKIIGGNTNPIKKPTFPQSILKRPSRKRDKKRGVNFRNEKEKLNCPHKTKKSDPKSKIKRAKANKSSRKITYCVNKL